MNRKLRRAFRRKPIFSVTHEGEMFCWVRDRPVDPDERSWLEYAVGLAIRFSREVNESPASHTVDLITIGRAAETLWAASPGAPYWHNLDVEAFLAVLDRLHLREMRDSAIASLIAFTHFLFAHELISSDEALIMKSRLDPYAPALMLAMGYKPTALPACLRPS